jgi:hypothetical protein
MSLEEKSKASFAPTCFVAPRPLGAVGEKSRPDE